MGYDFGSPAARAIFSLLPRVDVDPSFMAVAAKGPEAVRDWCRNLILRIDNAIMNIGFQPRDRDRYERARETFRTAVDAYYLQPRKGVRVTSPEWRAEDVAKAGKEVVDSCEELVTMRESLLKEHGGLTETFTSKVGALRAHEASVWKACQGTAVVQEAESAGKNWDAEFFREIVAKWAPAEPVGPGGGVPAGAHRLPPLPPARGPMDPPGLGDPGPIVEPPREPGIID